MPAEKHLQNIVTQAVADLGLNTEKRGHRDKIPGPETLRLGEGFWERGSNNGTDRGAEGCCKLLCILV